MNNYNVIYKCPICSHESSKVMNGQHIWQQANLSIAERTCDNCRIKTPGNEGIMAPIQVITIKVEGDVKKNGG